MGCGNKDREQAINTKESFLLTKRMVMVSILGHQEIFIKGIFKRI